MPRISKTILDNGIKVITEEMPDVESSSVGIWVKVGSRNEGEREKGISHFIEHMLFKGTKKRSAFDISREIESVGGVLNAFTGKEYTCFYAKVLNKDVRLAVELLTDMFLNSRFEQQEIVKERMVVLQEIKMVEDTPDDIIHDILMSELWAGSDAASPVLGSSSTVATFTREDVKKYVARHYHAGNVLITAAGGIKHGSVLKYLDKAFSGVLRGEPEKKVAAPKSKGRFKLVRKKLEQVHFCIGAPTVEQSHPDRYKVYLLNTILGGGMSSRLFQEVREKKGLAYSVYSYINLMKDSGSFVVYAGTERKKVKEAAELIVREFGRIKRGVKKRELSGAKEQLKGGMLIGLEASDSRMTKLARDEMYFGRAVGIREIVAGIDKVKGSDIEQAAASIFRPEAITTVAIGRAGRPDFPARLTKNNRGGGTK